MCDGDLGCQLRTNYFGFRLGALGSANFDLGYFDNDSKVLDGSVGGGFDFALTLRRARSESPQDGSFEGLGFNLGYTFEKTLAGMRHMPYFTAELWSYDGQLTPFAGLGYTFEQYDNGLQRHGGRILLGVQWRPWTQPMNYPVNRVNPYIQGGLYIGGEGNAEHMGNHAEGGLVIGLQLAVGLDFFPLF